MIDPDRIERAIAQATAPKPPRLTRDDFLDDAARRYGLTPDQAARIDADSPTAIIRQCRTLAVEAATAAAEVPVATSSALRPALVPGHAGAAYTMPDDFDPAETARRARQPY